MPTSCAEYLAMANPPGCASSCTDDVKRAYESLMPDRPCGPRLEYPSGIAGGSREFPSGSSEPGLPPVGLNSTAATAPTAEFPSGSSEPGLPPVGLNSTAATAPTAEFPSGVSAEYPSGANAAAPSGDVGNCKEFCADDSEHPWAEKCAWPKWCAGCSACDGAAAPPAKPPADGEPCMPFCADNDTPWDIKCTWSTICSGCGVCSSAQASSQPTASPPPSPSPAFSIGGPNRIEPWHEVEPWPRKDDPPSPPPLDSTCGLRALASEVNACWMVQPGQLPSGQSCASFWMPKGSQGDWSYCEAMTEAEATLAGDSAASKCRMGSTTYGACDGSQASSDSSHMDLQP